MNWLLVTLGPPLRAVRGVIGNRQLRRAELAFLAFNVAEPATWVAILVYAFDRGGTAETGIVALALLVPAAVVAPIAAAIGDRRRRDRVVAFGYAAQALATAVTALAMLLELPDVAVYGAAVVAMATYTTGRPGHHSLLPSLARSPEEVAAANSVSSLAEGVGGTVGTAAVTLLLAVSSPGVSYLAMALVLVVATLLAFTVRLERIETEPRGRVGPSSLISDAVRGAVELARQPGPRLLLLIAASLTLVWGTFDVLLVTLAFETLDIGEAGVGGLHTAVAVGMFVGAAASVALVGRSRLTPALVLGAVALGAAIGMLGIVDAVVLALVATGMVGAATTLLDVAGRTFLQRVVDDALLTRVFGTIEAMWMLGFGIGGPIAAALNAGIGLRASFVVIAVATPLVTLLGIGGLRRLDREAVVPVRQLELISALPIFAPLPGPDRERAARQLDRIAIGRGDEVIRQGDVGDRFYVIDAGAFDVLVDGRVIETLREGDHFGEVALLHDVPRTATVRAATEGVVWALDQEEFLATVTGMPQAGTAAHEVSAERLRAARSARRSG